jgi:Integrase core domain
MRQVHRAGEKLFVDYAGQTLAVIDPTSGEIHRAQVFVAVLGASNYTYAEATWTQTAADWLGAHCRALAYFGGCPEIVVPDNARALIADPDRYEPSLGRAYQEWAEHKVNRHGHHYTYYHCSKRRIGPRCIEPSIELDALEVQIRDFLKELYVPPNVQRVAKAQLEENTQQVEAQQQARIQSIERAIRETDAQLSELTGLRLRNLLTDEDFLARRKVLQQDQLRLAQQRQLAASDANRFEPLKDVLFFSTRAVEWFQHGDLQTKKLIVETVGSNLKLTNKILSIEARKVFVRRPKDGDFSIVLAFINDIHTALVENLQEAALITHNIRMLHERCEPKNTAATQSTDSSETSGSGLMSIV